MPQIYQDIDIFGDENYNGSAKEYFDKDALKNALTMWLLAKRGDYIEEPLEGGVIDFTLFKNMTAEQEDIIKFRIETAFRVNFEDEVTLISISITPVKSKRYLEISVVYRDELSGEVNDLTVYPTTYSDKPSTVYEEVPFIEESLFNYVKAIKPDMQDQKLVYNITEGNWIWGNRFKFTNFVFSDTYFETILEYINVL